MSPLLHQTDSVVVGSVLLLEPTLLFSSIIYEEKELGLALTVIIPLLINHAIESKNSLSLISPWIQKLTEFLIHDGTKLDSAETLMDNPIPITKTIAITIITTGFISNSKYVEFPQVSNQYENLEKYKNELEKINQYNQDILKDLENQIKNSDDVNVAQINNEINVIKRVINENKLELEQIISKLSLIESNP